MCAIRKMLRVGLWMMSTCCSGIVVLPSRGKRQLNYKRCFSVPSSLEAAVSSCVSVHEVQLMRARSRYVCVVKVDRTRANSSILSHVCMYSTFCLLGFFVNVGGPDWFAWPDDSSSSSKNNCGVERGHTALRRFCYRPNSSKYEAVR